MMPPDLGTPDTDVADGLGLGESCLNLWVCACILGRSSIPHCCPQRARGEATTSFRWWKVGHRCEDERHHTSYNNWASGSGRYRRPSTQPAQRRGLWSKGRGSKSGAAVSRRSEGRFGGPERYPYSACVAEMSR